MPKSWVPDLDISDLMESESGALDPGDSSGLNMGPHEGDKESPTTMTSGVHTKPTPTTGSLGLLMNGSERSPDLFKGENGGRSMGSPRKR